MGMADMFIDVKIGNNRMGRKQDSLVCKGAAIETVISVSIKQFFIYARRSKVIDHDFAIINTSKVYEYNYYSGLHM